jgi:hypothetical protein
MAHYMTAAQQPAYGGGGSRQMPSSVKTASWGLGLAGGLALVLGLFCVFILLSGEADAQGRIIGGFLMVVEFIIAAANIGAVVMLQNRTPGARIVGFLAAALSLLGSPCQIFCGVMGIIGLAQGDTGRWLAGR